MQNPDEPSFFYKRVPGSSIMTEKIPGMKTGRQLPKIYSQQDIQKILTVHYIIKYPLILYLACGCGLRLNEIKLLIPERFDFECKVIIIENAKGNKNKFVMIYLSI